MGLYMQTCSTVLPVEKGDAGLEHPFEAQQPKWDG